MSRSDTTSWRNTQRWSQSLVRCVIIGVGLVATPPAWATTGAEVLKLINHDNDQTLEIPEVIDAATKLFYAINPDNDTTLERRETVGRITEADWAAVNKDHDDTLEMDEWLTIARKRFIAADADKDGKLTAKELDSPAGQLLIKLIVK